MLWEGGRELGGGVKYKRFLKGFGIKSLRGFGGRLGVLLQLTPKVT